MQCSGNLNLCLPTATSCVIDAATVSCDRSLTYELPLSPGNQLMYESEELPLHDPCNQLLYDTQPPVLQVQNVVCWSLEVKILSHFRRNCSHWKQFRLLLDTSP